jgi:hypothetical protein
MSIYQRIILLIGAAIFVYVLYFYPVRYTNPEGKMFYDPLLRQNTSVTVRVDIGATALRGVAIIGATTALWAATRNKKTE